MVTVLGGQRASPSESGLHLALAASACHALQALLATETPGRVPAFYVADANDRRSNYRNHREKPWEGDGSQKAVDHASQNFGGGCCGWGCPPGLPSA
ncbi:hypothetical protein [Arthrobacter sp. U41]|uniref:hypothetical protein n=1 Tax=Arthrobacter sp. U41 TaxID=1849032 RepID=UPI001E44602D|nr:hypothetical protein [Arthrobacter sp. U41]